MKSLYLLIVGSFLYLEANSLAIVQPWSLNLRSAPSLDSSVNKVVTKGEEFHYEEHNENWIVIDSQYYAKKKYFEFFGSDINNTESNISQVSNIIVPKIEYSRELFKDKNLEEVLLYAMNNIEIINSYEKQTDFINLVRDLAEKSIKSFDRDHFDNYILYNSFSIDSLKYLYFHMKNFSSQNITFVMESSKSNLSSSLNDITKENNVSK